MDGSRPVEVVFSRPSLRSMGDARARADVIDEGVVEGS